MASTDLDHFRKFIFESSFLDTYEMDQDTLDKIKIDDVELMFFSFKYLGNTLFGAEGLEIKKGKIMAKVQEIQERQDDSLKKAEEDYLKIKAERERRKKEQEEAVKKTKK